MNKAESKLLNSLTTVPWGFLKAAIVVSVGFEFSGGMAVLYLCYR